MNNKEKYEAALAAFKKNNYEETVKIISELLENVHPHPPFLILLGRSLIELDKPLNALLALKKYRAEISEDTHLLLLLAETYTALFLNELAIQIFQRCINSVKFNKDHYFHFSTAILQDDCVDRMINVFSRELGKYPSLDELRYTLGIMHLYVKNNQEALLYPNPDLENAYTLILRI